MKQLIILTISLIFSWFCHGQTVFTGTDNMDCEQAFSLCETGSVSQSFNNSPCSEIGPYVPLFYTVEFGENTSGSDLTLLSSSSNALYSFYGPYSGGYEGICTVETPGLFGTFPGSQNLTLQNSVGVYLLVITPQECAGTIEFSISSDADLLCGEGENSDIECSDCITSFSPTAGEYIVSAWVKKANAVYTDITYDGVNIKVSFEGNTSSYALEPRGQIIDGWQRIEEVVEVPTDATGISLSLNSSDGDAYFDDIRFVPFDGSMMSYVYDPVSLRLMAELDERNYATFYEYDEEGKLIRIKKETERGVMTIQENRDNIKKK